MHLERHIEPLGQRLHLGKFGHRLKVPGTGYAPFFAPALSAYVAAPFVQSGPLPQRRLDGAVDTAPAPRYDGGPNEGSADIAPGVNLPARPNQAQAFPGAAEQAWTRTTAFLHRHLDPPPDADGDDDGP